MTVTSADRWRWALPCCRKHEEGFWNAQYLISSALSLCRKIGSSSAGQANTAPELHAGEEVLRAEGHALSCLSRRSIARAFPAPLFRAHSRLPSQRMVRVSRHEDVSFDLRAFLVKAAAAPPPFVDPSRQSCFSPLTTPAVFVSLVSLTLSSHFSFVVHFFSAIDIFVHLHPRSTAAITKPMFSYGDIALDNEKGSITSSNTSNGLSSAVNILANAFEKSKCLHWRPV